ncbi:YraN family protein [Candidatus Peregrinibacteria bacterium CG_4_10_14_0_2_um_filter_43_11]|nr:MAG: YraN family protein [Candidatus Peregrinibacteria bacterium CG_4_10_14_0_2_um_filter_43_11]
MNNQTFGKRGEEVAREFLKKKEYEILATNFQKQSGEIDIIAKKNGEYVFVEVKTRQGLNYGYPEEAVTPEKINRIIETGLQWLEENDIETENYRIDVIAIETNNGKSKITHLENVSID